mgnify:CR=1 FL=1
MNIGDQITSVRREQQLTQEQFGGMFHVTRQTVSNWENGKSSYSDKRSIWGIPRYSAERRYGNGKGDRQGEGPRKSQAGTICYQLLHWRRHRFGGFLRSCSGVISPDGGFHRRLFDDLYWLVEAGAVR